MSGLCPTRTFTTTYGNELFFVKQKQGTIQNNFRLFRALAMYMSGHNDLDSFTSRYFTELLSKSGPKNVRGVSVEDLPVVQEIVQKKHLYIRFRYSRR